MNATLEAFLSSWPFDPWLLLSFLLTGLVYVRGWRRLRQRGADRFGTFQLYAFLAGLTGLFLALASPIEPFAHLLLLVHMIQHLLLMMVAPPLLWLGEPLLPLLVGLPAPIRQYWVAPFWRWRPVRRTFDWLTRPAVALALFVIATWFWHLPQFYELALASDGWHRIEHLCFVATGLLFWWPVIQPYPSRARGSRWIVVPYLFAADVQNTALSALLSFSSRAIYLHYERVPRLWNLSPQEDQAAAGVLMWVPGSVAYLVPLMWIVMGLLFSREDHKPRPARTDGRLSLLLVTSGPARSVAASRFDLLRLPLLGRFLHWRHARLALQLPLFVLAIAIILDGFTGPPVAGMNLAGVVPWIHWRGLLVVGLLVAGNVFCMACPFMLPRRLAKWLMPAALPWPRQLRSKWLALALLVLFFWTYEVFSLWASPWWTAFIALGYFLSAFVIDGWFRGAAFCKYVCPIGQFNFVQSLVSPLEVSVRDREVCQSCVSKDCIRGRGNQPGCELHLFLPRKTSNMDCTLCLDCIHACPHDNIGIVAVPPGAELWRDPQRSGVGRFGRRPDLAALVVLLVFAAFANAAGMVAPVVEWQDRAATASGLSPFAVTTGSLLVALLLLPALCVGSAAMLGGWWSADPGRPRDVATRFAFALLPLGFGMWLTHYLFHFLTSFGTLVPVVQRWADDLAMGSPLGVPEWSSGCCVAVAPWLLRLELLFLDFGLLLSLYTGYRIARERRPVVGQALRAFAPWAGLIVLLFAAGVWIVFQPMEMRGTISPG